MSVVEQHFESLVAQAVSEARTMLESKGHVSESDMILVEIGARQGMRVLMIDLQNPPEEIKDAILSKRDHFAE